MLGKLVRLVQSCQAYVSVTALEKFSAGKLVRPEQLFQQAVKIVPEEVLILGKLVRLVQSVHAKMKFVTPDVFNAGIDVNELQARKASRMLVNADVVFVVYEKDVKESQDVKAPYIVVTFDISSIVNVSRLLRWYANVSREVIVSDVDISTAVNVSENKRARVTSGPPATVIVEGEPVPCATPVNLPPSLQVMVPSPQSTQNAPLQYMSFVEVWSMGVNSIMKSTK